MEPATFCLEGMFSEQWRTEPATHCLEGMFSTAVEDGTSNTLFRSHVLNCSGGWNQQHIVLKACSQRQWRMEPATHCVEDMFSTAVEDGTSNTLFRRHVLRAVEDGTSTHCLEGMFSTAVEDGTSNTFRRHVLNCEEWRMEPATHCLEGIFSTVRSGGWN